MDVWDLYFSTIVGWNLHPGNNRDNAKKLTLEEAAKLANEMCEVREKWHTGQQE